MAFPGSKSRCSNFCALSSMSPSYIQGSHRKMPPPDRSAFTVSVRALTSVFSWYSCLSFPTVSSPYLQNLPILPSQKFPSLSIPPSTHSSLSFLTHFICWLAHSLGSPVSLSVALCSPQALPLSEHRSLSHVRGEPLLLLPPLDNENGAHFLKSALLVQKPFAHG